MRRHNIVLAGILVAATVPLSAGAISNDELLSQIRSLLGQITQLQAQIALLDASSGSSSPPVFTPAAGVTLPAAMRAACPALTRSLSRGSKGDDVRSLQSFLLSQEHLGQDGVTGYFGPLTESAVKLWQKNNDIVSSGTAETTGWGFVGARTRSAIFSVCDSSIPLNDKLSLTERGLSVTLDATVNARSSCNAQEYTLDFGDETQPLKVSIPVNTCRPLRQSFDHTYTSGGRYIIVLSSGASRVNAPITLVAPPACSAPVFAMDEAPAGVVGVQWTFPLLVSMDSRDAITVSATGTPPGIVLATTSTMASGSGSVYRTWVVTGIPTATGTYNMIVNARNFCGNNPRTFRVQIATTSPVRSCTVISCAPGYHAIGTLCSSEQTCVPN